MKGVTRRPVIKAPLTRPVSAATTTPPSAAVTGPWPLLRSEAITTVASATAEPTERSMPPRITTSVIPTEHRPRATVCRAMVTRLTGRANVSGTRTTKSR